MDIHLEKRSSKCSLLLAGSWMNIYFQREARFLYFSPPYMSSEFSADQEPPTNILLPESLVMSLRFLHLEIIGTSNIVAGKYKQRQVSCNPRSDSVRRQKLSTKYTTRMDAHGVQSSLQLGRRRAVPTSFSGCTVYSSWSVSLRSTLLCLYERN